ncbi:hypothetical protein ACRQ5Q_44175 (plasmid) [Bradyrhizobium sp. PMVTL-01]|uniref:hypothetical protein n=1 Tax=Bradyrhizobium sp. PMVTL-01 TaxID=3434999 RepID=UPI003F6F4AF3
MKFVSNPTEEEPHHALPARMDEELAHTLAKIRSVDEQIARASEQLSRLERVDVRSRPRRRPAVRGLIGLVLWAGICAAAFVSQSSHGERTRQMIAEPQRDATPSPSQAEPVLATQSSPAAIQSTQAQPASLQPAPVAEAVAAGAAPGVTTLPPELTELLQKMASDLTSVQQGIEQLKASQEELKASQQQLSLGSAKVADELKASQERMARLVTSTPDNKAPDNAAGNVTFQAGNHPTTAAAPRAAAASARKPAPAARRSAPVQLESAQQ